MTLRRQGAVSNTTRKRTKQQKQCTTKSLISNSPPLKKRPHPPGHVNGYKKTSTLAWIIADTFLPWAVAIFSLATFITTCPPGISGGDSGELLAQACQLGIAHPPGNVVLYYLLA